MSGNALPRQPIQVVGETVDDQTRCIHYHLPEDVVAIQFHCCREFYPCFRCHADATDHVASVWPREQFHEHALLCGVCRETMSITDYQDATGCPSCGAPFNPGCLLHHGIYFAD